MKTPREILFSRHREAEPQLDETRRRVVAGIGLPKPMEERPSALARLVQSGRELFRLPRVAWAGLGAAWTVIIALNIASSETPPAHRASVASASRSPEMLYALREQRRLFADLVGAAGEAADVKAPRLVPRPRSERSAPTHAA
jgi:hypothetical protein